MGRNVGDNGEVNAGQSVAETTDAPNHDVAKDDASMAKPHRSTEKPPAFQFYPRDYLSDAKTRAMSFKERGMYWDLVCHCWLEGRLPSDDAKLARILGVPIQDFKKHWPALEPCFRSVSNGVEHPRLEIERRKQADRRARMSEGGRRSGDVRREGASKVLRQKTNSASASAFASSEKEQRDSSETLRASEPAVLVFPTIGQGPKTWDLTEAQRAEWQACYPGEDVLGECQKALAWVKANHAKTAKGMPAFLVKWLNRAADRGGGSRVVPFGATGTEGRGRTGRPEAGKYAAIEEHD